MSRKKGPPPWLVAPLTTLLAGHGPHREVYLETWQWQQREAALYSVNVFFGDEKTGVHGQAWGE